MKIKWDINHIHLFHYNMFYLEVSFHVFNYKDKQNQNRPPSSINLVPNRLNVPDRFVTCQKYTLVFLMVNNSWMCVAFFRWFDFDFWCFNATFSSISAISWRSVLVVEEFRVPGENHRPLARNWYTLSLAAASRVHPYCNLQSQARSHAVLAICLYALLDPTT